MTDRENELHRIWDVIPIEEQGWIHLRAIHYLSKHIRVINLSAQQFECPSERKKAFAKSAFELNDAGYNIYTCFNPIKEDLALGLHDGVLDKHIARRTRVLIDLDRAGEAKDPADEQELRSAFATCSEIEEFISQTFLVDPFKVMSGNGYHLYLPIDLPNDESSAKQCKQLLRSLHHRFSTDRIQVDIKVHNASRITKVPGTIARKGTESRSRPYRMARVV